MLCAPYQATQHSNQTLKLHFSHRVPAVLIFLLSVVWLATQNKVCAYEISEVTYYANFALAKSACDAKHKLVWLEFPNDGCNQTGATYDHELCSGNGSTYFYFFTRHPAFYGFRYCVHGFNICSIASQIRYISGNCVCPMGQKLINSVCHDSCPIGYVLSGTTCLPNNAIKLEKNLGPTECGVGNPIIPSIANKVALETDYHGPASSSLHLSRTYNSQGEGLVGWRGNGWTHDYSASITVFNNTTLRVQRAKGQRLMYTLTNGVWMTDSDVAWSLSQQRTLA